MRPLFIFIMVLLAVQNSEVTSFIIPVPLPSFSDIVTIAKYAYKAIKLARTGYKEYTKYNTKMKKEDAQKKILKDMAQAVEKIDEMRLGFEQQLNVAVNTLLTRLPLIGKLDSSMKDLHNHIVRVDSLYNDLVYYTNHGDTISEKTLMNYVKTVTSHNIGDLLDSLAKINGLILPGRASNLRESLLYLYFQNALEGNRERCNDDISPHLKIYEIYGTIALTELRAFTILVSAYGMEEVWDNTTYKGEMQKAESQMVLRYEQYLRATKEAMANCPRDIRSCDAKPQIRLDTYFELERLAQAYIINELDMTNGTTCKHTCPKIPKAELNLRCEDSKLCPGEYPTCQGNIYDCTKGGGSMEICRPPDNAGHRRYTYFKDNNGKTYGQNEGCAKPSRKITVSWWIYYLFDCDYCMCTCWEQSPSTPPQLLWLINLMSQLTDWKKNKVLTGVRFVRTDRTVAIQIKQGKLLPSGAIDSKTDEWKPIEKIEWGDKSPAGKIPYFKIKNGKRVPIKKNRDYAFIGKKTQINLDEIVLPKNFIATGVKIQATQGPGNDTALNSFQIVIIGVPFDYETGEVRTLSNEFSASNIANWHQPLPAPYMRDRSQLKISEPHDPLQSQLNLPDSEPNQYMKFQASDWNRDAGQSTVPFFDSQAITMKPSLPLSGIALYHKGAKAYGGFLALKVVGLNISQYLQSDLSKDIRNQYQLYFNQPLMALTPQSDDDNTTIITDAIN